MAKKYNHRRAEDEYKKMKKKDEKFMRENDMPETKILIMRTFDRKSFNSDRRFYEKVDFDSEKIIAAARQPEVQSLSEPKNVKDFIDSLASIALVDSLKAFGFETQLIAFFLYRGYKAKEISVLTGIPEWTISRRISELIKTYKFFKSNT